MPVLILTFKNFLDILSKETYEILPLLLKFTRFRNIFCQWCSCCHNNPIFDTILVKFWLFYIFLLITDFFKTIANSLSQSQEIDIFS